MDMAQVDEIVSDSYSSSDSDDKETSTGSSTRRLWGSKTPGLFWQTQEDRAKTYSSRRRKQKAASAMTRNQSNEPLPVLQTYHVSPEQAKLGNQAATEYVQCLSST